MDFTIDPRIITSASTNLSTDKKTRDLESLRETSREFETIFLMEMMKAMRKATPKGGLFEKSNATEIFEEMLDLETAKTASQGKGLGIGEAVYKQMEDLIANKK